MKRLLPIIILSAMVFALVSNKFRGKETASTPLPRIFIEYADSPNGETKKQCKIKYVDFSNSDSTLLFEDTLAKFKLRGDPYKGGARGFKKKSFTIKLSSKQSLGNLNPDKKWILNANYMDKSMMRHKLSYDLFRSFKKENIAPKCSYIEVYLNGKYNGLYVLMERPDSEMYGLSKNDTMSCLFKDPGIFYAPQERVPSRKGETNLYWQKYPNIKKRNLNHLAANLSQFMFHSSDSVFAEEINKKLDITNIIDWHIYLSFCNNNTGHKKNFYLYKPNSKEPFKIGLWDGDRGFGRDDDNEKNFNFFTVPNVLIDRLTSLNINNYNRKLSKRWEELKNKQLSEKELHKLISKNYNLYKSGLEKNFKKWPVDDKIYFDPATTEEDIKLMKEFLKGRYSQMDEYIDKLNKK